MALKLSSFSGRAGLGLIAGMVLVAALQGLATPTPTLRALEIKAARQAPVRAIDYDQERCDRRSVEQWLKALTGPDARTISWTAGRCQIVGPGIDQGSDRCVQAHIALAHPQSAKDRPMVEVFFESPVKGRPGKAYAFRGLMQAADGLDMSRFRKDFEYDWTSRFPAAKRAIKDCAAG